MVEPLPQPEIVGEPVIVAEEIAAVAPGVEIEAAAKDPIEEPIEDPVRAEVVNETVGELAEEAVAETQAEPEVAAETAEAEVESEQDSPPVDEAGSEAAQEAGKNEDAELEAATEVGAELPEETGSKLAAEPDPDEVKPEPEAALERFEELEKAVAVAPRALDATVPLVEPEPAEELNATEEAEPIEALDPVVDIFVETVETQEIEVSSEGVAELYVEVEAEAEPEANLETAEAEAEIEPASEPVENLGETEELAVTQESEPALDAVPVSGPEADGAEIPEIAETLEGEARIEAVTEPVAENEVDLSPEPESVEEISELEVVNEASSEPVEETEVARAIEPDAVEVPEPEFANEDRVAPGEENEVELAPEPNASDTTSGLEGLIDPISEFVEDAAAINETKPNQERDVALGVEPEATEIAEATAFEEPEVIENIGEVELLPEPAPGLEAAPAPAPDADAAPVLVLAPTPTPEEKAEDKAEEKTAARLAARQKKLDEGSEQSPFSVFVGQVYDGPLDLLLDLIRKQDIDIYYIPIAKITAQFLAYVNQLKASDVDVAGEFIYTASLLIHIKSRMLLPRASTATEDTAEDPRRELVERLLEHERFKNAAQMLQQKQMLEAASWTNPGSREFKDDESAEPEIAADTVDLVRIFRDILERARKRPVMNVEEDSVTVGQMIQFLARRLTMEDKPVALRRLLSHTRSERALIAMFLALLELVRMQAILLRQDLAFSEIFIKKHTGFDAVMNEGLANARDDWR
ncbi:MAG: segregation/condensation protein A [Terracidiphilus sp.]